MDRGLYDEDHEMFREVAREFISREVTPHYNEWAHNHLTPRDPWLAAGEHGLLGLAIPEEYGGLGITDYRYRAVLDEEFAQSATFAMGLAFHLHDDLVLPYILDLGNDEQKERWLPKMASGEIIGACAFTEPEAGSDLSGVRTTAVKDGDHWVLNGQKTFIGNGIQSDLAIVLASTGTPEQKRFTLFGVERGTPGFESGKQLQKLGLMASDTAELFFDNVRVPSSNIIGSLHRGLGYAVKYLDRARLAIAVSSLAIARTAFNLAEEFTRNRKAFGQSISTFQNTRFELADISTQVDALEAYVDKAILSFNAGKLNATDTAKVKLFASETQKSVVDRCVQLHGGYGYMAEYPIAQAYLAARLLTIFGGTSEIMKEIIGRRITR